MFIFHFNEWISCEITENFRQRYSYLQRKQAWPTEEVSWFNKLIFLAWFLMSSTLFFCLSLFLFSMKKIIKTREENVCLIRFPRKTEKKKKHTHTRMHVSIFYDSSSTIILIRFSTKIQTLLITICPSLIAAAAAVVVVLFFCSGIVKSNIDLDNIRTRRKLRDIKVENMEIEREKCLEIWREWGNVFNTMRKMKVVPEGNFFSTESNHYIYIYISFSLSLSLSTFLLLLLSAFPAAHRSRVFDSRQ